MSESLAAGLSEVIGDPARVLTAPAVVERLSKDFYWYSPVLKRQLESKVGDIAVQPVSVEEVLAIGRYAGMHKIPITVRGAGTGNYGQCIPLHGGIILDLALMDKLEEVGMGAADVSFDTCESFGRRLSGWRLRRYWLCGAWWAARLRYGSRV